MIVAKTKHRSNTPQTASKKKYHVEQAAKARAVMAGFPIKPRLMEDGELNDYFSGDKITCLRCGKDYKVLGTHLLKIHNVSVYDYQVMYGIPLTKKLVSKNEHERMSATAKDLYDQGLIGNAFTEDVRKNAGKHKRRKSPYLKRINTEKLKKTKARTIKNYHKKCPVCSEAFVSKRNKIIYCSKKCHVKKEIDSGELMKKSILGGAIRAENAKRSRNGRFVG